MADIVKGILQAMGQMEQPPEDAAELGALLTGEECTEGYDQLWHADSRVQQLHCSASCGHWLLNCMLNLQPLGGMMHALKATELVPVAMFLSRACPVQVPVDKAVWRYLRFDLKDEELQ